MRGLRHDSSLFVVMTESDIPVYIERSKISEFPLGHSWGPDQYKLRQDWVSDGSRSSIVRKLEPLSVRAR